MLLVILKVKKLLDRCTKKIAKNNKVQIQNVIKRNSDKQYAKWKGYSSSFNSRSQIDKKEIV